MTETVHILLPAHNRREVTRKIVECLAAQTYRSFHLVLIDDGSIDGTADMVRGQFPEATVLRGDGRLWWAGSLQRGYEWLLASTARPDDLVLIINDDTVFGPEFLGNAVAALRNQSRTLLLAQQYSQQTGKLLESGVHVDWSRFSFAVAAAPEQVNCLSTRGLFMRMSDMREIGGFHPRLLPHYGSDYEFTMRARRMGFRLHCSPEVKLWDNEATTGIRTVEGQTAWTMLGRVFLPRNQQSPWFWSMFVFLACPPRYWIVNLIRVWTGFARQLRRARWTSGSGA